MAIPDFQSMMLPLLKFFSSQEEHSQKQANDNLAHHFNLTETELSELIPSGTQSLFTNRISWAISYLKMASLITRTRHGHYKITENGINLLKTNPPKINLKLLKSIPEYKEHTESYNKDKKEGNNELGIFSNTEELTPEESIEDAFQKINSSLAQDLLQNIKNMSPAFFERLVIELLVKMGYGGSIKDAGKAIGKSGDGGIDGIIKEDRLGLDIIYVQAKRWDYCVGSPEIQKFVGALAGQGAKKGVFITTSYFSKDAIKYTPKNDTKIVLIDGEELAQFMIEHNLAVTTVSNYIIKKIDTDYFDAE